MSAGAPACSRSWCRTIAPGVAIPRPLVARIDRIAQRGYEVVADETLRGITDVSFPILDGSGTSQAALTMPFVLWVTNQVRLADASRHLYEVGNRAERADRRQIAGHRFRVRRNRVT